METWGWIVIAVVVVIVIAAVVALAWMQRARRRRLRDQFGPEYDRAVEGRRRGRAERDLDQRVKQREEIDIRPLSDGARERYVHDWEAVQSHFVDRPEAAIESADSLIRQVMREEGYPVDDFEEQAELVSVDHPHVVENYRAAHDTYVRHTREKASTEELRQALVSYRTLFDELVSVGDREAHGR
ncbi:MAG TPA: hypothetical protein VF152_12525 [Acidimicrobiia bacterium]